ncbi:hypothetical protein DXG01_016744 [Tephrocybe rancida]|nr:hypothetical protein DXG01_016744 [Tephrocybe rancida]
MLSKGLDANYFQEVFYYFESLLWALLPAMEASDNAGRKRQFEGYLDLELGRESTPNLYCRCNSGIARSPGQQRPNMTCILIRIHMVDPEPDNKENTFQRDISIAMPLSPSAGHWHHSRPALHSRKVVTSGVSLDRMCDVLDPDQDPEEGSGYNDLLPGPSGDGEYSTLSSTGSVDQTAMEAPTMFDKLGKDIIDPPPYRPWYSPIHFRHPPLGVPTFEAPTEHDVSSKISWALMHMPMPLPDTKWSDNGNDSDIGIPGNGIIISDDDTKGDNNGNPSLIILSDSEVTDDDSEYMVTISDEDDMQ